jgi:hypothetical protein
VSLQERSIICAPASFLFIPNRLNRLLKNSLEVKARVELAFRPASKFFVFDSEPALAGGSNYVYRVFQQPLQLVRDLLFSSLILSS